MMCVLNSMKSSYKRKQWEAEQDGGSVKAEA